MAFKIEEFCSTAEQIIPFGKLGSNSPMFNKQYKKEENYIAIELIQFRIYIPIILYIFPSRWQHILKLQHVISSFELECEM